MPPIVLYSSRRADARDLVWVTDAAQHIGARLNTVVEWKTLGAQLRAIDDTLQGLWWELRPVEAYEKEVTHREEVADPCQYEWLRLLPSVHGGRFGLWKTALAQAWTGGHKNLDREAWDRLERLITTSDRAIFEKENWSGDRAFRLLSEMSAWFLTQKQARYAEIADAWAHWILHPLEQRPRTTQPTIETPIRSDPLVTRTRAAPKKKKDAAAAVGPSNPTLEETFA